GAPWLSGSPDAGGSYAALPDRSPGTGPHQHWRRRVLRRRAVCMSRRHPGEQLPAQPLGDDTVASRRIVATTREPVTDAPCELGIEKGGCEIDVFETPGGQTCDQGADDGPLPMPGGHNGFLIGEDDDNGARAGRARRRGEPLEQCDLDGKRSGLGVELTVPDQPIPPQIAVVQSQPHVHQEPY